MIPRRSRRGSVMLVQASAGDREMYADFLRSCGFKVVQPQTTAEALAKAHGVDVIVTGIFVPGPFDGLELLRRVRNQEGTREKPVVVLTACALESLRATANSAGCDAFLTKPYMPDDLAAQIHRLLAGRPRRMATPSR